MRKGSNLPMFMTGRRPWGARLATEEGNLTLLSHGSSARGTEVPSLRANRPTFAHRHCLTHPRRNRRWARGVASHAASRRAVALGAPPFGSLALPTDGIHGVAWLAACLSSKEGGLSHAARFEQERAGIGGQRIGTGSRQRAPPPARARIGRSRSCSRVVEVSCRSRRTVYGAEKRTLSISPDLEAFRDGRLARGPTHESV